MSDATARDETRVGHENDRVRIATALFRFSKRFNDPWIILDALLATAGQIAAEHELDPGTVRRSLDSFLAAARQDHRERQIAGSRDGEDIPSDPVDRRHIN